MKFSGAGLCGGIWFQVHGPYMEKARFFVTVSPRAALVVEERVGDEKILQC